MMSKDYAKSQWKEFRDSVIELDGYKCTSCGRNQSEVVLQVHHLKYIKGRMPWEYGTKECRTLCKGCHASMHGILFPQIGWEYIGYEDLGDLIGTCEKCSSSMRHAFYIYHENWGAIQVGTYCCDKLTDTDIASNLIESETSYQGRRKRFITTKKWKQDNGILKTRLGLFDIDIKSKNYGYYLKIHNLESKKKYESLIEAKSRAFDVIESGEFVEYLKTHKIDFDENRNKTKKKKKE